MQQQDELYDLLKRLAVLLDLPLERICQAFIKGLGEQVMHDLLYATHQTPPHETWYGEPDVPIATEPRETREGGAQ